MATSQEQWASWLARFLQSKRAANRAENTLISYEYHIKTYLQWLAEPKQKGMNISVPETIEAFIVHQREAGFSPYTVVGRFRSLRAWYNYLVKRVKCMAASPMEDLEEPTLPDGVRPHVKLNEFLRLFDSIEPKSWFDYRDRCMLYLLFWCGLRVSEVVGLSTTDVDTTHQAVTVRASKGNKGRVVPCGYDLSPLLAAYLMRRPKPDPDYPMPKGNPLFLSNNGVGGVRGAITDNGVRQMLRRRCRVARMEYQNPHRFRHGYSMLFLNNGMDLSAVSKTLGHASEQFTARIYAHWLPEGLRREYQDVRRKVASGR